MLKKLNEIEKQIAKKRFRMIFQSFENRWILDNPFRAGSRILWSFQTDRSQL